MIGNSCAWHRGKVIGGTSVVNGMLYVRGSKEDYNEWYRQGNPGKLANFQDLKLSANLYISVCSHNKCTIILFIQQNEVVYF